MAGGGGLAGGPLQPARQDDGAPLPLLHVAGRIPNTEGSKRWSGFLFVFPHPKSDCPAAAAAAMIDGQQCLRSGNRTQCTGLPEDLLGICNNSLTFFIPVNKFHWISRIVQTNSVEAFLISLNAISYRSDTYIDTLYLVSMKSAAN